MEKKRLEDFSLSELEELKGILETYHSLDEILEHFSILIKEKTEKKEQNPNALFNMEMFIKLQVFTPWELEVLVKNNINNIQELIDCDLDHLDGMTYTIKEKLDWARKFYDMRGLVEEEKGTQKKKTNRKGRTKSNEKSGK